MTRLKFLFCHKHKHFTLFPGKLNINEFEQSRTEEHQVLYRSLQELSITLLCPVELKDDWKHFVQTAVCYCCTACWLESNLVPLCMAVYDCSRQSMKLLILLLPFLCKTVRGDHFPPLHIHPCHTATALCQEINSPSIRRKLLINRLLCLFLLLFGYPSLVPTIACGWLSKLCSTSCDAPALAPW